MLGGYSQLKDLLKDPHTGEISTGKSLLCSAAAGGAAHAFTYPLHLARTVLQQPVPEGGRRFAGFVDVLTDRVRTQGTRLHTQTAISLYLPLSPSLSLSLPLLPLSASVSLYLPLSASVSLCFPVHADARPNQPPPGY